MTPSSNEHMAHPAHDRVSPSLRRGAGRRAFTLLEVLLAASCATLVAIASVSLFLAFTGSDKRLERRFEQHSQLSRVHLVVERALSSLVLSERAALPRPGASATASAVVETESVPTGTDSTRASEASGLVRARAAINTTGTPTGGRSGGSTAEGSRDSTAGDRVSGDPAGPKPPPRMILEIDHSPAAVPPVAQPAPAQPPPRRMMARPQRLELVLSSSPVPNDSSRADTWTLAGGSGRPSGSTSAERSRSGGSSDRESQTRGLSHGRRSTSLSAAGEGESDLAAALNESPMRAVRGAFELRPQQAEADMSRIVPVSTSAVQSGSWELWWVPLPPRRDLSGSRGTGEDTTEIVEVAAPLGEPFRIARDIAYMEWRMIVDRQRTTNFQAIYQQDLPAYVELEIETVGGLYANWLFEISSGDYVVGAEVPTPGIRPGGVRDVVKDANGAPTGGVPARSGDGGKGAEVGTKSGGGK